MRDLGKRVSHLECDVQAEPFPAALARGVRADVLLRRCQKEKPGWPGMGKVSAELDFHIETKPIIYSLYTKVHFVLSASEP